MKEIKSQVECRSKLERGVAIMSIEDKDAKNEDVVLEKTTCEDCGATSTTNTSCTNCNCGEEFFCCDECGKDVEQAYTCIYCGCEVCIDCMIIFKGEIEFSECNKEL